jgi:thioredoxin-like negative regulator of GroEL
MSTPETSSKLQLSTETNSSEDQRSSDALADTAGEPPRLLFFFSPTSGLSRRVDGFLAQVLQRRANHSTFVIHWIDADQRPDLVERFQVTELPTLLVVSNGQVCGRLTKPTGCSQVSDLLSPWLK